MDTLKCRPSLFIGSLMSGVLVTGGLALGEIEFENTIVNVPPATPVDLNSDGLDDLAGTTLLAEGIFAALNNADETFMAPMDITMEVVFARFEDLNQDGAVDLFGSTTGASNSLAVQFNDGSGAFNDPITFDVSLNYPPGAIAADLDGDGDRDLVVMVAEDSHDEVYVAQFTEAGFKQPTAAATISSITLGTRFGPVCDYTGDGHDDILITDLEPSPDDALLFPGTKDAGLGDPIVVKADLSAVDELIAADFDNDGDDDLAGIVANQNVVQIFLNKSGGTFIEGPSIALDDELVGTIKLAAADIDGDGSSDLINSVYAMGIAPQVRVRLNDGNGSFGDPISFESGTNGPVIRLKAAQFNDDDLADLYVVGIGGVDVALINKTVPGVPGDVNGDGFVALGDLLIVLEQWGRCPDEGACPADLNNDASVNTDDLLILLANWA